MFKRIVVGCDGTAEGRDAVVLAPAIASATALRAQMELALRRERDSFAPDALVETVVDLSVPRALCHFAQRRHADLVVLGSDRSALDGHFPCSTRADGWPWRIGPPTKCGRVSVSPLRPRQRRQPRHEQGRRYA